MLEAVLGKEKVMARSLRLVWVLLAFAVLAASLLLYDGRPNSDADILLGYAMLTLSFPIGAALAAGLGFLGRVLFETMGYVFTTSYASMAVVWLVFFIAGYLQWFVFVPKMLDWRRARRRRAGVTQ